MAALTPSAKCLGCGLPLSHGAAEGLCARCLLMGALATSPQEEMEAASELESPATLLMRREFAGYQLIEEIARGGMGVVFRARQKRLERVVALKVIAAGELATPRMIERFRTEAQAAARLDHPNIVPIHEVGHQGGWHFFSMRLIEGGTLSSLLRGGNLPPDQAVRLMVKIARAVEHAHQRGVLHRDLKPGNVLIDARGEPHLTDFGLAKVLEGSVEMTFSNAVLGTPAYMAPEQAAGGTRDVTVAVDVYGLGALLYEMLAGRPPFEAANTHLLLRKIAEDEPVPPSRARAGPIANGESPNGSDLDAICLKCLEKEPALRYRTAADFADDLERALRGEPILAKPSTATQRMRKWVRRHPARSALIATAVVAMLVITIGSLLFSVRLSRARQLAEWNAARSRVALVGQHLRENARLNAVNDGLLGLLPLVEAARISSDDPALRRTVNERAAATLQFAPRLLRVWDAQGVPAQLSFSAGNERLIATLRDGSARVWNLRTGNAVAEPALDGRPDPSKSVVSPDGAWILQFHPTPPHARLWNVAAGIMRSVALDRPGGDAGIFGPDSTWFATGGASVRVWNTATGREMLRITNDLPATWLAAGPDGNTLVTGHSQERAWRWDIRTGERIGAEPVRVWSGQTTKFSADGRSWLVAATGEVQILRWPSCERAAGVPVGRLLMQMSLSPDGGQLATAGFFDHVRVWNTTNSQLYLSPVVHESGANIAVFSPDGALLATAGFDYQLRVLRALDHRPVMPAIHRGTLVRAVSFSGDSRFLAAGDAEGLVQVWELTGGAQPLLVRGQAMSYATHTPDGRKMLLNDHRGALHVLELENAEDQRGRRHWKATGEPLRLDGVPLQVSVDMKGESVSAALGIDGACIWDLATHRLRYQLSGDSHAALDDVRHVVFKPDGSEFVTASRKGMLQRWRTSDGQPVGASMERGDGASLLVWSPDGRWIAAGRNRTIHVWDAQTSAPVGSAITGAEREQVKGICFAPDGGRVAVTFGNESITPSDARIFELPSLRPIGGPMRHGDGISSGAFSPNGTLFATSGEDNVVRIWRSDTGGLATGALRHQSISGGVLFSPDNRVLATGCVDGTVRLWDVERGELLAPPLQLGGSALPRFFSSDERSLFVSAGNSASNIVWRIDRPSAPLPGLTLDLVTEGLTAQRPGNVPVPTKELVAGFLRQHGDTLPSWPEDMRRWHEESAAVAERRGAWFTAAFHLERLAAIRRRGSDQ